MYQFDDYKSLGTPKISTDNFDDFLSPNNSRYSRRSVDLSTSTLQVPGITAKPRPLSANLEDLWKQESISSMFAEEDENDRFSKSTHGPGKSSKNNRRSGQLSSAISKLDFSLSNRDLSEALRRHHAAIIIQRAWHDYCRRTGRTRGRRKSRSKSPLPRFLRYVKNKLKRDSKKEVDYDDLGLHKVKTVDF
ncbi:hypothetical protein K493DRAFT_320548 [Basidiobolus meristosporus CBS 931.73]|uniref:Uncharacterized protein n=1 Tax=Basidiobolus meristosporus CBS 931.73 TaxID=1314790 RepID=A0A1Y1X869_9FUNG|nr:hypothetical protein K493DRAFT_320548 [Basidiobolus meristosporus CBS 931.73]|eukprot:ORX81952.1 hypothetical protein K493DRAFT_320548 [Basidiobolus meristosporus CBS 931.73]